MSENITATRTHQMIFVNLPVADIARSRAFFESLGYGFNEEFSNEDALGLELGPNHYAMLLRRDFFAGFHDTETAAPHQREVLNCLSAESKAEVDDLVDRAIAAGGRNVRTQEYGEFMYGRTYADLDEHFWEIMWMDMDKAREANTFG